MKDLYEIDFWECPYCKRRISTIEYDSVRFDYQCNGTDVYNKKKRCPNQLSDYVPKLKLNIEDGVKNEKQGD